MAAIKRVSNYPYQWKIDLVAFDKVANKEKKLPRSWINESGNYVTEDFIEYAKPLIQGRVNEPAWEGLPRYFTIEKNLVEPKLEKWEKDVF